MPTTAEEGLFQFAVEHVGVVLTLLALAFTFISYLIIEREKMKTTIQDARTKEQDEKFEILERIVERQSKAMSDAVTQMKLITDELHTRITDLSGEFRELRGEHDAYHFGGRRKTDKILTHTEDSRG